MNNSDFYTAHIDDTKYDDVCDIRKKSNKNATNSDVLESFSGLECPSKELFEWESNKKQYRDKFKKAKQCVQRRITTMKKFGSKTAENKHSRKKHIYPVQVAYTYATDCLKKFATKKQQNTFRHSIDTLINEVSKKQSNIKNYFKDSIEKSIHTRGNTPILAEILHRKYYDDEQLKIIDKARELGYDKLNSDDKERFLSIIDEGFSRNTYNLEENNALDRNNTNNGNNTNNTTIHKLKKNIKHYRVSKKKPKHSLSINRTVNLSNLNTLLQSNEFKITNNDRKSEIIKRITEIGKIYGDSILLSNKLLIINDITNEITNNPDTLNDEGNEIISKLQHSFIDKTAMTKKALKKMGINENYADRVEIFNERNLIKIQLHELKTSITERIVSLQHQLAKKLNIDDIPIKETINIFYKTYLSTYLLRATNEDIAKLSEKDKNKLSDEEFELNTIMNPIEDITKKIRDLESKILSNNKQLETFTKMSKSANVTKRPDILPKIMSKLKELKAAHDTFERDYLRLYSSKTNMISEIIVFLNKKYHNIYVLKRKLEEIISITGPASI